MSFERWIRKAAKEEILCHGLKCSIRDKCLLYNLEPNDEQAFIQGYPTNVQGNTVDCNNFKDIKGGTHEQ